MHRLGGVMWYSTILTVHESGSTAPASARRSAEVSIDLDVWTCTYRSLVSVVKDSNFD